MVKYTFRNLLEDASLMARYGILLLGGARTTGFGKSKFAQAPAIQWTLAIAESKSRQPSEAM
eukprot:38797-Heterocapsa_arctica.AAC.1